ncbi:hypothetical protein NE686_00490 [Tissierella carlieri]|uniref:Spo0E like sporulation regulatory protein n=1 Tax=Tissierella carlieri TaxID=689904 RepID=A0ABT1S507_9FIRM|nr:hypothetical protein [Tissierella carlieri]MCQ4921546.1 hypothetical protein [Tissierella carlieri]
MDDRLINIFNEMAEQLCEISKTLKMISYSNEEELKGIKNRMDEMNSELRSIKNKNY